MKAPDKIYIEQDMINNIPLEKQYYEDDVIYIRKDALLEWAKEQKKGVSEQQLKFPQDNDWYEGETFMLDELIEHIESL